MSWHKLPNIVERNGITQNQHLTAHLSEVKERNISVNDRLLVTSDKNVFGEDGMQETKVIEILKSKSKIIVISNLDAVLVDISLENECNSISGDKSLVYLYYLHVHFVCSTKIKHTEIAFIPGVTVLGNAEMRHCLDTLIMRSAVMLHNAVCKKIIIVRS